MNGFEDRRERLAAFDTRTLLVAVDDLDRMRDHLEGEGTRPPEMRDDLLRLHQLAMRVINQGSTDEDAAGAEGLVVGASGWFTPVPTRSGGDHNRDDVGGTARLTHARTAERR